MSEPTRLVLPETYEDLASELGSDIARMVQFVVPVENAEQQLAVITQSIKHSGKIAFLLGTSGIGKSTFIESLTWRKFLPIPQLKEIDASMLTPHSQRLEKLFVKLQGLIYESRKGQQGLFTIVVNYLEDFSGYSEESTKALFRDINGLLRNNPALIIWPVTQADEAAKMVKLASNVSSTIFANEPIIEFKGPPIQTFPKIAKRTIETLNPGLGYDEFQLTDDDFANLLNDIKAKWSDEITIRNYIKSVRDTWESRSGQIREVLAKIPKFTEIWFVVCFPEAENIVGQFARKSSEPDLAWDADIRKFSEYVNEETQRAAEWDQRRLMQALYGYFKTKVLYIPTHALVSSVVAFGKEKVNGKPIVDPELTDKLFVQFPNKDWQGKSAAKRLLKTSPVAYQLQGLGSLPGQRRGNPKSVGSAKAAFLTLNQYISSRGDGSDQPINKSLALGLRETLGLREEEVSAEKYHPWLTNVRPDILVETNPDKIICIEIFYTAEARPYSLAYYVLRKLNVYMKQLDAYMKRPPSLFD